MKMLRHVYRAITLAIFLAIFIAICVRPASADFYHDVMACQIICTDQTVALGGKLSRVDILYPGTPQQGIFMSVTLFPPFTHYETDGKTYLRIYPDAPIGLSDPPYEIKVVTFKTILDWGLPGGSTPFTYVGYGAPGFQVSGVLYNLEEDVGGIVVPVDKLALIAPYIGLASIIVVATAIYFKRVKHRKEEQ